MKHALAVVILLVLTVPVHAGSPLHGTTSALFAADKAAHFGAGYIVFDLWGNVSKSKPMGLAALTLVAGGKEWSDKVWDWTDFEVTVTGGLTACAVDLLFRKHKKPKMKPFTYKELGQ